MATFVRFLFAFTIGSHILIVTTSIAMIFLISISEFISIYRKDQLYERLSRRLSKVFVVAFGVGTASGIVMAVELVALFPSFMTLVAQTGVIVLFYAEVFAFFMEVLALVLYVYYWNSFKNRYLHWLTSLFVASGTVISALFITMVNAWMNTPNGFDTAAFVGSGLRTVTQVQPWAAFMTASTVSEVIHVLATTLFAGSMVVGCYFAYWFVRSRDAGEKAMLSRALRILGALAMITIIFAGVTGSNEMATLLSSQPLKYAALDANFAPGANMAEHLFGNVVNGAFVGGISVPGMQSFLAQLETGVSYLPGLSQFPTSAWPPLLVHTTFNVMIVGGMLPGVFFFAYFAALLLRRRPFESRAFLYLWVPLAVVAMVVYQLGWATDEIGRQPWIVYNVMTVEQAANLSSSLFVPGVLIVLFYLVVVPATLYLYARVFNVTEGMTEVGTH
jgi:cytochrome bd ubiquinol oxidase subunit I